MKVCYKRLWKLLIDKDMTKRPLRKSWHQLCVDHKDGP